MKNRPFAETSLRVSRGRALELGIQLDRENPQVAAGFADRTSPAEYCGRCGCPSIACNGHYKDAAREVTTAAVERSKPSVFRR